MFCVYIKWEKSGKIFQYKVGILSFAKKLKNEKNILTRRKSYDIINRFAESFDILCHLATLSSLFPAKFDGKKIAEKSLAEFLKDFSPILTDFEDSLKNKDTVLTGDLAEYELKPRLEAYISDIAGF